MVKIKLFAMLTDSSALEFLVPLMAILTKRSGWQVSAFKTPGSEHEMLRRSARKRRAGGGFPVIYVPADAFNDLYNPTPKQQQGKILHVL
mmetsp:Transcript_10778/g.20100  ORF Transcript_10778/g.20100 Transcript_10778/m.20100 type:complete len:90 (-) Transcript_10778:62-331(-)